MDIEIAGRMCTTLPEDDGHLYRTGPWRRRDTGRRADDSKGVGVRGEPGRFLFSGLLRHGTATRVEERHELQPVVFASETTAAPRVGSTAEGDAYFATLTVDIATGARECHGFDSGRLADGPVARLRLPGQISSSTHVTWAPGWGVPTWSHVGEAREAVRL